MLSMHNMWLYTKHHKKTWCAKDIAIIDTPFLIFLHLCRGSVLVLLVRLQCTLFPFRERI